MSGGSIGGRVQHSRAAPTATLRPILGAVEQLSEVSVSGPDTATGTISASGSSVGLTMSGLDTQAVYAIAAVSATDNASGSTTVSIGTPTLSGCGITWALIDGPHAGLLTGTPDINGTVMLFAGFGTPANGTLTFGLGTTTSRALNVAATLLELRNFGAIARSDVDTGGSAGASVSASLSAPYPNGGGLLGIAMAVGISGGDPSYTNSTDATVFGSGGTGGAFFQFFAGFDVDTGGNRLGPSAGGYTYPVTIDSDGQNTVWLAELQPAT